MFLKQSANLKETEVLKVGFYKQTPGKLPCPAENAVRREELGQLPGSSRSSWRLASLELESVAIKILFKKPPPFKSIHVLLEDPVCIAM